MEATELRTREAELRLALQAGRMGTWSWDVQSGAVTWSDTLEPIHGLEPGSFDGRFESFIALVHPEDRAALIAAITRAVESAEDYDHEFRIVWPNGSVRWMEGKGRVLRDDLGRPERMVGIGIDATERKMADEVRSLLADATRAFAEAPLDSTEVADELARRVAALFGDRCSIQLIEPDGQRLRPVGMYHADPAMIAATRAVMDEDPLHLGEGMSGRVAQTGQPLLLPRVDDAMIEALAKPSHRARLRRRGIHTILVVPIRVGGRVIGALDVSRDQPGRPYTLDDQALLQELVDRAGIAIENARLYETAQEAVAVRDRFISIASHELRTPIAAVKGQAQLMLRSIARGDVDPERLSDRLREVNASADRLIALVDDLLDVARLRTGRLPLAPRPTDLSRLARQVATRLTELRGERGRVALDVPATPCAATVDPARIEQVLVNLIENALKYSPDGGELVVTLRPEGEGFLLAVSDRGIGLPAGAAEAIFEPFGRAPNARHLPGMGLGLHVSRGIVEQHGGRMWAESAGEGQGTRVSCWLPTVGPVEPP